MSKSRSFSIYLLKKDFDALNTLKVDSSLLEIEAKELPDGAVLYILDNNGAPPWWRSYFGIKRQLMQMLKGAIVFLPVRNKTFAITFGNVYHNLKPESYEYDFGLRVTLNSVDPIKLKSLDSLSPENARRQRTQLPVGSDLTLFDFDRDSTILKSLTGKVRDELKPFFKFATGASNIRISSDVTPAGLPGLCAKLLELYQDETFKTSFPNIQNVVPVKDPIILNALNVKLIESLRAKDASIVLTVPDIVNYADEMFATFAGEGAGLVYDDIFLDRYFEYLKNAEYDLSTIDIPALKKHNLVLTNEAGQPRGDRPNILKCLIYDTSLDGSDASYHLCEGNWYLVDGDFVSELSNYLDPLCAETSLRAYNHDDEAAYNEAAAAACSCGLCMDRENIAPTGQTQVEPCDIFEVAEDKIVLHHVKRSTVSATLSHLFNQGLNSIQLVRDDSDALEKLKALAIDKADDIKKSAIVAVFEANRFKVIFQIITHKDKTKKSRNLPLFSRISLKRTMKELRRMGIESEFCFVENQVEAAEGKKKKRKKKKDGNENAINA
ncbi:MAG: TIGR04141 family sporadically distributed protein [Aquisalinus sp.]|nr:TIGR04141 family sporadically distributed protein [Aquisalinus sp.]